ncbi:ras GTPase-activating protein 1-like [Halichondria panicea]|uniref:ras GTPase-activating protein 1-like n=1 Tax=Halichondria panicea TaxID=6063 RepID=UPI00312B80DE
MATGNTWWAEESDDRPLSGRQAEVDVDDTLPEPIYIKNSDLAEMRRYMNRLDVDDDVFSGDEEDEEGNLNLTAPPLESWFHGRISRPTACERLELMGKTGCYLVRESIHEPSVYILCYLSHTSHVHHFKIHSNCGDYYIGGRQFLSLGDLIGFYANCSCILENESLEMPVVPPRPVTLYMMLKATSGHTKTPATDELNIRPGEVFLLLSRLNDDWVWGRSQRTGESGIIPIVIMEDVTEEDPNLGKPWFYSTISREGAVELVESSDVGNFIVRLSGGVGGGADEVRYSMAVRTHDRVQRFLITRYITGYYVFGGRPYNSLEDIIERYRKEVILDGLKLGSPVLMEAVPSQQLQPRGPPVMPRKRSNSKCITHDTTMPGDRAEVLQLRKGKKCPVYGKWRELYVVVKYHEQKLIFYENENSHRAKGLLDLKQCRVYAVHPSLYGRLDCFVVMLKFMNELSFHYLAASSPENAKEWVQLLRQCTSQGVRPELMEIQQNRSLSLIIKECRIIAKGCSQVFALVYIDGVCLGRTRVMPESPYIFDETFTFEDLPQYAETFSCDVHSSRSKRLGSIVGRENCLGRIHVHMSDLPNGQADDRWHQLMGGAKTPKGSVRLVANFKDLVILPLEEYNNLKELILSPDLKMIELLAVVCKEHHAELASTIVQILCSYDQVVPVISACLAKSIEKEENMGTLFRASTLSTMLMDQFMKLTASSYLRSILKGPIQQIIECPQSCEINPSFLAKGDDVSTNLARLEGHLQHVISVIFKSVDSCPPTLRFICRSLQEQVVAKWPLDDSVRIRAVSGFLFLRFVCPALLKPQLFDLISENPSPKADRALKLVTKGVQNLANLVEFKKKEDFTMSLNPFILKNSDHMRKFVDDLASYSQQPPSIALDTANPRRDLATIHNLCSTYEKSLSALLKTEPDAKKLLGVMQTLRVTEKKYTNKAAAT